MLIKKIKKELKKKLVKEIIIKEKVIVPCSQGDYLKNRTALITGGTSGIGFAIAKAFIENGSNVIITGRHLEKLQNSKRQLLSQTKCVDSKIQVAILDISNASTLETELESIVEHSKEKIDILVNNAGINGGNTMPDTSLDEYDNILNTNLRGTYFVSQFVSKYMISNKIKGNILNIASSSSLRPATSPYIVSKWGERGLTLGMAKKFLPYGIVVNGIAPGSAATPMLNKDGNSNLYLATSPSQRYVTAEEVSNLAVFMVSDMGKMIVGDIVYMTGGAGVITYDDIDY